MSLALTDTAFEVLRSTANFPSPNDTEASDCQLKDILCATSSQRRVATTPHHGEQHRAAQSYTHALLRAHWLPAAMEHARTKLQDERQHALVARGKATEAIQKESDHLTALRYTQETIDKAITALKTEIGFSETINWCLSLGVENIGLPRVVPASSESRPLPTKGRYGMVTPATFVIYAHRHLVEKLNELKKGCFEEFPVQPLFLAPSNRRTGDRYYL